MRATSPAVGVLSIILSIVYLALPALAIGTLIFLSSIGLLVTGVEAIAAGVIGRNIVPVVAGQIKPRRKIRIKSHGKNLENLPGIVNRQSLLEPAVVSHLEVFQVQPHDANGIMVPTKSEFTIEIGQI